MQLAWTQRTQITHGRVPESVNRLWLVGLMFGLSYLSPPAQLFVAAAPGMAVYGSPAHFLAWRNRH